MASRMPNDVEVLILGESHTTAISRAIADRIQDKFVCIDVRKGAGTSKVNEELFANIKPSKLILAFGGTEHNIIGMIESDPPFDLLWPPYDEIAPERMLIPASALEDMVRHRLESSVQRALMVRSMFNCPAFAIAPPPPFSAIDEKTKLPSAFTDLLEAGISPARIRRKLYSLQCHVMRETYAEHGIPFIFAPSAATDDEGFLLRRLWNRDPTHGNPHYGALMLDQIEERLGV